MTKEQYTAKMHELIDVYASKISDGVSDISDSEMTRITDLFYRRDWDVDKKGHALDGLAFQRGMQLGMILYRQILAKSKEVVQ